MLVGLFYNGKSCLLLVLVELLLAFSRSADQTLCQSPNMFLIYLLRKTVMDQDCIALEAVLIIDK